MFGVVASCTSVFCVLGVRTCSLVSCCGMGFGRFVRGPLRCLRGEAGGVGRGRWVGGPVRYVRVGVDDVGE